MIGGTTHTTWKHQLAGTQQVTSSHQALHALCYSDDGEMFRGSSCLLLSFPSALALCTLALQHRSLLRLLFFPDNFLHLYCSCHAPSAALVSCRWHSRDPGVGACGSGCLIFTTTPVWRLPHGRFWGSVRPSPLVLEFLGGCSLAERRWPCKLFSHTHTHKKKVQGLLYMRRERERFVRGTCGLCAFVPVSSGDRVHFLVGMAELTSLNWDFSIQRKIQQADSEPACTETLKRCVFLFLLLWAMARTCPEACRRPS
jgi:hypothetical protein